MPQNAFRVSLCVSIKFIIITSYCSSYLCQHLLPLICYKGPKELSYVKLRVFKSHRGFYSLFTVWNYILDLSTAVIRKLKYYQFKVNFKPLTYLNVLSITFIGIVKTKRQLVIKVFKQTASEQKITG